MVLVAGGSSNFAAIATAELYDPVSGTWIFTGSLNLGRYNHFETLLNNGLVLAAAGDYADTSAELYDPGTVVATKVNGRGAINGLGDQVTFNFHAAQSGDRGTGSLSFSDPAAAVSIIKGKIRSLTITGSSADFSGIARLGDGSKVRFSVSVMDNSAAGSTDTFTISLSNGYAAGGALTSGGIRIH